MMAGSPRIALKICLLLYFPSRLQIPPEPTSSYACSFDFMPLRFCLADSQSIISGFSRPQKILRQDENGYSQTCRYTLCRLT